MRFADEVVSEVDVLCSSTLVTVRREGDASLVVFKDNRGLCLRKSQFSQKLTNPECFLGSMAHCMYSATVLERATEG